MARAATQPRRYISAQAYYHALRAALSEARGDLAAAADELQLALVYDHESLHLTLELGRVSLALDRVGKARKMAERARRLAPRRREVLMLTAGVARARGDLRAAERILRGAARRERAGIEASLTLAELLMAEGRPGDAVPVLRRAAEREPQSIVPLERLAEAENAQGRLSEAVAALERALRRAPERAALLVTLTDLYERSGRLEEARARWRDHLELHPGDPAALRAAARVELLLDGDSPRLRRLEADTKTTKARRALARVLVDTGRYSDAARIYDDLDRDGALDAAARLERGRARYAIGDRRAALVDLEGVGPEAGRDYIAARHALAQALAEAGQLRRAQGALRVAMERRPQAASLFVALARSLARSGDHPGAVRVLEHAHARGLEVGALLRARATIEAQRGSASAALAVVRDSARKHRAARAQVLWAVGRVHLASDAPGRAVAPLRGAARRLPGQAEVHADLARALLAGGGRPADALTAARHALSLTPRAPGVLAVLGRALAAIGDLEHARTFLMRAARLSPRDPTIMEDIGDLELESGDRAAAREAWRSARRTWRAPGRARHPEAAATLARLGGKLEGLR